MKGRVLCKKKKQEFTKLLPGPKDCTRRPGRAHSNAYRLHGLNELGTSKPLCFPSPQGEVWTRPYSQGATNSVVSKQPCIEMVFSAAAAAAKVLTAESSPVLLVLV